ADPLHALNVGRYLVRFSSRAVLNLLLDYAEISPEQGVDVFRVLDKLDKVGIEKVRLELMQGYKDESGDSIRGVGLSAGQVEKIDRVLAIRGTMKEVLAQLRDLLASVPTEPLSAV